MTETQTPRSPIRATIVRWLGGTMTPTRTTVYAPMIRALPTGRTSVNKTGGGLFGLSRLPTIIPPPDTTFDWRLKSLDDDQLARLSPSQILDRLIDLSPEVSRALWEFLREMNPGFEAKAIRPDDPDDDDAESEPTAQRALDAFLETLEDLHGSLDVLIGRLNIAAFLRGAYFAELVLDETGRIPLDLATPDPASVRFRKVSDDVRGEVWEIGQIVNGQFVSLALPTVSYLPIDPAPGSPYGRAIAAPGLFTALFLLSMLYDLKRVVQQQGYPRLDLSVDVETLAQMLPEEDRADFKKVADLANAQLAAIGQAFDALEPDATFAHTSDITVNRPTGAMSDGALSAVDGLIAALERMATRALKASPLTMGLDITSSESQANRLYEAHARSIRTMQHYCETLLERLLTLALEAQGIRAKVVFRFAEARSSEELRDAQVDLIKAQVADYRYRQGWISQDQAAEYATGQQQADAPAPRNGSGDSPNGGITGAAALGSQGENAPEAPDNNDRMRRGRFIRQPDPILDPVDVDDALLNRAADWFDTVHPDYAGMLRATVVNAAVDGEDETE